MSEVRRSVLTARVVVETTGSAVDHERAVQWAANRMKTAHQPAHGAAVALRITGPHGRDLGFAGHGDRFSPESREIIDDFFDEATDVLVPMPVLERNAG